MLSPLQRRVAFLLAALPEAEGFALAGGGALIARGVIERVTRDLDFFADDAHAVDRLLPALESALTNEGLTSERRQVARGFARLRITSVEDHTELDLGVDSRLLPATATEFGATLALEELAVNKLLALFGRAEARDFVDLAALEPSFGLEYLCRRAAEKDTGFDRGVLREMLARVDRLPADEFGLDADGLTELHRSIDRWRSSLTDPERGRGPGRSI